MDDDFVETSDIEEREEYALLQESLDLSPRPRKRQKLFHDFETDHDHIENTANFVPSSPGAFSFAPHPSTTPERDTSPSSELRRATPSSFTSLSQPETPGSTYLIGETELNLSVASNPHVSVKSEDPSPLSPIIFEETMKEFETRGNPSPPLAFPQITQDGDPFFLDQDISPYLDDIDPPRSPSIDPLTLRNPLGGLGVKTEFTSSAENTLALEEDSQINFDIPSPNSRNRAIDDWVPGAPPAGTEGILNPKSPSPSTHPPQMSPHVAVQRSPSPVIPEERRYSFRDRAPAQMAPYTSDYLEYRRLMADVPEAIVRARWLHERSRRDPRNHYEDEEYIADAETQEQSPVAMRDPAVANSDEDDENGKPLPPYLEPLPSSDDEQRAERRVNQDRYREIRRREKERAREAKKQREAMRNRQQETTSTSRLHRSRSPLDATEVLQGNDMSVDTAGTVNEVLELLSDDPSSDPIRQPIAAEFENDFNDGAVTIPEASSNEEIPSSDNGRKHAKHPGSSGGDSRSFQSRKQRKQMQALGRVMPKSMIKTLQNHEGSKSSRRQQGMDPRHNDISEDEGLQPGRSKKKVSHRPQDPLDIRGDSESSSDERPASPVRERHTSQARSVISVSSGDEQSADEALESNDFGVTWSGRGIDRVLARTRPVQSKRHGSKHSRGPQLRLHIGGPREKRQTRLPFTRQDSTSTSVSVAHGKSKKTASRRSASSGKYTHENGHPDPVSEPEITEADIAAEKEKQRKQARRDRERARREQAARSGQHFFARSGIHISTSLWNKNSILHQTFAPKAPPPVRAPLDRPRKTQYSRQLTVDPEIETLRPSSPVSDGSADEDDSSDSTPPIQTDFGVSRLSQNRVLSGSKFIDRGWLHELVELVVNPPAEQQQPPQLMLLGVEMSPTQTVEELRASVDAVCKILGDASTGLPDLDVSDQIVECHLVAQSACQIVSWHLYASSDSDASSLCRSVQTSLLKLVDSLREATGPNATLDEITLLTLWFLLNMAVRIEVRDSHNFLTADDSLVEEGALHSSISLAAELLLNHGMTKTMGSLLEDSKDPISIDELTAVLWVCLLRITDAVYSKFSLSHHPVWEAVSVTLPPMVAPLKDVHGSEYMWRVILSLCTLSRFNVHGRNTNEPRLPACWDLALTTIRKVRLDLEPGKTAYPDEVLDALDDYLAMTIERCEFLALKCHWKLDTADNIFKYFGEVFRNRRFANLRNEEPDFPVFLRNHDINLLYEYDPCATAYTRILQLFTRAANPSRSATRAGIALPAKLQKLMGLIVPIGSCNTADSDRSMLFNRLTANYVGLHIDPAGQYIKRARNLVTFKNADDEVRLICIRCFRDFGEMMVAGGIPLDEALHWLGDMTDVLVDEWNSIAREGENMAKTHTTARDVAFIFRSVYHILHAHSRLPVPSYPCPGLLLRTIRIFQSASLRANSDVGQRAMKAIIAFLEAREANMPTRPRIMPSEMNTSESQDEFASHFEDFDLDAIDEALQTVEVTVNTPDHEILQFLQTQGQWFMLQHIRKHIELSKERARRTILTWVTAWVRCIGMLMRYAVDPTMTWSKKVDTLLHHCQQADPVWLQRVLICAMTVILNLDINAFPLEGRVLEVFFQSLVAFQTTAEHEFVELILRSRDGLRHPLLQNLPIASPDNPDWTLRVDEFVASRSNMFQAVLDNVELGLQDPLTAENARATFIPYILHALGVVKDTVIFLKQNKDPESEEVKSYMRFCHTLFSILESHPALCAEIQLRGGWRHYKEVLV